MRFMTDSNMTLRVRSAARARRRRAATAPAVRHNLKFAPMKCAPAFT
jgi:hypothetical protein